MMGNSVQAAALIRAAIDARKLAYTPYSAYSVGAALLGADGKIYTGCNIENAAYSVCNCAERTALFKAVSEGQRQFAAMAVVGGEQREAPPLAGYAYPCGVCRQALLEFAPHLRIYIALDTEIYREFTLDQLLPESFGPRQLGG